MWAGTQDQIVEVTYEKGIDGSSNVIDIPEGYSRDAVNLDISKAGRGRKRAGYNVWGCVLPVRTRNVVVTAAAGRRVTLDSIPLLTLFLNLYANTGANATEYGKAEILQTDDRDNTLYAVVDTGLRAHSNTVTTDTVFEFTDFNGNKHLVCPVSVFDDNTFIFPLYVLSWIANPLPVLSDVAALPVTVRLCRGFSFKTLRETDIDAAEVSSTAPGTINLTITDEEIRKALPVGTQVLFETVFTRPDPLNAGGKLPLDGYVSAVNGETVTVIVSAVANLIVGSYDLNYFTMRYLSGKSYWYKSEGKSFVSRGPLYSGSTNYLRMLGTSQLEMDAFQDLDNVPAAASYNEVGFLYGTDIDVGYLNFVDKYFDAVSEQERILTAYDGNVFKEEDYPFSSLPTIASLRYTGASTTLQVNPTTGDFLIPLPSAEKVYKINDVVSVSYAINTANEVVTESYIVSAVEVDELYLASNGDRVFVLRKGMQFVLTRASSILYLQASATTVPLCAGMTVQVGERNSQQRWLVIKEVLIDTTSAEIGDKAIILDDEVSWDSDGTVYMMPYYEPIFQPSSYLPINPSYENRSVLQLSTAFVDRSVYIASLLNGIWRFNGVEVLNMRIPMPPPGLQRNVPGGGGLLRVDRAADGTMSNGRTYEFYVTYSYAELLNGVIKEYESATNPVGSYTVISQAADNERGGSKLVEVQVPTIPEGIGLPARDLQINLYRKLDGDAPGSIVDQPFLLEKQIANNPDTPYVTALVGFESELTFTADQRKTLYTSLGRFGDAESARQVDDPPLASMLVAHENRLFALNGFTQPFIKVSCSEAFDPSDNSFAAHAKLSLVPVFSSDTAYRFVTCPAQMTTVSAATGAGALGYTFQVFRVPYYEISRVDLLDNSDRFSVTGFAVVADTKYLLRFSRGQKENPTANTDNLYYAGFDFEKQVFKGVAGNTVQAQRKWTAKDELGAVITPPELFYVFTEQQTLTTITPDNGLQIGSNDESSSLTDPTFTLKIKEAAPSIVVADYIILHGLGTLGEVKDEGGTRIRSFDSDLVFDVLTATNDGTITTYKLAPVRRARAAGGGGAWEPVPVTAGYPVSNASGANDVTHGNVTIYVLTAGGERAVAGFTLPPSTFSLTVAAGGVGSPPALPVTAGTAFQVQGLPVALPEPAGLNYNGRHELISVLGMAFTFRLPSLPADAVGDLSVDMTAFVRKGRVNAVSTQIVKIGSTHLEIYLQSALLTVAVRSGQYLYMVCRGPNPDNYCLELTGWFKISEVYDGVSWSPTLPVGSALSRVRIEINRDIDYDTITGLSDTRLLFANATSDSEIIVPVPVPYKRGVADDDITGTAYGPVDGFTSLEKVVRRFVHAVNSTINHIGFAYWGGNAYGRIDGEIPVNGLLFYPHLYPVNRYAHTFDSIDLSTLDVESRWELAAEANLWTIEGDSRYFSAGLLSPKTVRTAKEYYPAKFWYTDAPSADTPELTRAFRVESNDQIASSDGEELVTAVAFQHNLVCFKNNSVWRLGFTGGSFPIVERAQSVVGCESRRNAVATDRGVLFLHSSGVYITDGSQAQPVVQLSRFFDDLCVQNRSLFSLTAGHHNPLTKNVYIGVPFGNKAGATTDTVEGQFVFNYSRSEVTLYSIQQGWTRNTNIPATSWIRILDGDYFSSSKGKVYRVRPETGKTRYRDEEAAISGQLVTRYVTTNPEIQPKLMKSAFFQFGTETAANMSVRVGWDNSQSSQLLDVFPVGDETFGVSPFGTGYFGASRFVNPFRRTMGRPSRVPQVSFTIENEEKDVAGEVYGIFLEMDRASTDIIPQKGRS